jgi:hypothetical protein
VGRFGRLRICLLERGKQSWSASLISERCFRPIAATAFLLQQLKEQVNRFFFAFENMLFLLTTLAYPSHRRVRQASPKIVCSISMA